MKLHKLLNGNWLDLAKVTSIKTLPRVQCWAGGPIYPARVVICTVGQGCEVVSCDDEEQASQIADELAGLVNAATTP